MCFLKMIKPNKTIIAWNFNNTKIKVAMSDNCSSCILVEEKKRLFINEIK